MTKKDYLLLASTLASVRHDFIDAFDEFTTNDTEVGSNIMWSAIVARLSDALALDNDCFNRTKFIDACKGGKK